MAGEADSGGGAPAPSGGESSGAPSRARIGDLTSVNTSPEVDSGARLDTGGEAPTLDEAASAASGTDDGAPAFDEPQIDDGTQEPTEFDDSPIFGVAPAELLAGLRKGELPNEVIEQLIENVPIFKELHRGFMRQTDYSRKTAESAELKRRAEGVLQQDEQRWQTWGKDPSAMYDEMEQRGLVSLSDIINKRGPLVEIAMHIADTYGAFKKMSPAEQSAFIAEQNAIAKERALQEKERELQERDRAYQNQQLTTKYERTLQQMVPVAFGKVKLQDSPLAQKVFKDRLLEVTRSIERWNGLTQEMVDAAAAATVETLRELARFGGPPPAAAPQARGVPQVRPQQQQRPAGGPPPPTPLNGGRPGTRPVQNGAPKRARIGDFSPLKRS